MVNAMPRFVCLALSFSRLNSSSLVKFMSKIFLIKHMFHCKKNPPGHSEGIHCKCINEI